jgi:Flp pilus assembly protein TadD
MGDLWLQVLPVTRQDREALDRDFAPKMTRDDIAGLEKWLEAEPRNAQLHAELAAAYADEGRTADAIGHLEEAARLDPVAGRFYDLGLALLTGRKFDRATEVFGRALELKPQFSEAVLNLGVIAHAQGRLAEAVGQYTRAIRLGLDDISVHYNLGRALSAQGQHEEAAAEYRRTIQLKPEDAEAHRALGSALSWQRRTDEAIAEYRRALQLEPDMGIALIELAWILARSDRLDLRDPAEAVRLAARAADLTARRDPLVLDALAAAYMAADQIDPAIENAEAALRLAASAGDVELSNQLRARLESYRQRQ